MKRINEKKIRLALVSTFLALLAGTLFWSFGCASESSKNATEGQLNLGISELFLKVYMSPSDRETVSDEFLKENTALALKAFNATPWKKTVPDHIFLNEILPYSSIQENAEDWRPLFYEKFSPLVKDCKTPTAAAETLNREIWKILDVAYSPERDKPDQTPFHSMRIKKASCTGLSIILVDACRAVGVPARLVSCNWKNKPGNHTWVEVWEAGEWHFIGATDSENVDSAWFTADVAHAVADEPEYAIYASSWRFTGTFFPPIWDKNKTRINAHNVTARYLALFGEAAKDSRLSIDLRNAAGERVAVPVLVVDAATDEILERGTTHDAKSDLNNHLSFSLPAGTKVKVLTDDKTQTELFKYIFPAAGTNKVVKAKIDKK